VLNNIVMHCDISGAEIITDNALDVMMTCDDNTVTTESQVV